MGVPWNLSHWMGQWTLNLSRVPPWAKKRYGNFLTSNMIFMCSQHCKYYRLRGCSVPGVVIEVPDNEVVGFFLVRNKKRSSNFHWPTNRGVFGPSATALYRLVDIIHAYDTMDVVLLVLWVSYGMGHSPFNETRQKNVSLAKACVFAIRSSHSTYL